MLSITERIVREHALTCLMVTHNMESALEMGNRTLMMHQGRVILDVEGEERKGFRVSDLMEKFRELSGSGMNNDRMLLN